MIDKHMHVAPGKRIRFRTYDDLFQSITDTLPLIKSKGPYDFIVGVPRSGITPAVNLSIMMGGIPYADLELFTKKRIAITHNGTVDVPENARVLLVDDTLSRGEAMDLARRKLQNAWPNHEIVRYCVWTSEKKEQKTEIFSGVCPKPRVFEWNIWKIGRVNNMAFDMDGVLCRDPTSHENDKGKRLIEYYLNAQPKFIPSKEIGFIITNRLERNRPYTEEWLDKHNVKYKELIMKEDEREAHVQHKVRKINQFKTYISMYVESSVKQSRGIAEAIPDMPIWCIDDRKVYNKI